MLPESGITGIGGLPTEPACPSVPPLGVFGVGGLPIGVPCPAVPPFGGLGGVPIVAPCPAVPSPRRSVLPPVLGCAVLGAVSNGPSLISPSGPCTAFPSWLPGNGAIVPIPRMAAAALVVWEPKFCPVWGTKVPARPDEAGTENAGWPAGRLPVSGGSGGTTATDGLHIEGL